MNQNLYQASAALLQKKNKPVIWGLGVKRDFTIYEWQRQVEAAFVVDPNWRWWNKEKFHGLEVLSPSEIARLNPAKTLVIDNNYLLPEATEIEAYLKRIGGYPVVPPHALHDMGRALAVGAGKVSRPARGDAGFVVRVDAALRDILTDPFSLDGARRLPSLAELTALFGSYAAMDYIARAVPLVREEAARTLRPRDGHVCLMIGALHPGGANRQICNLAVGLKRAGWTPTVLTYQTEPNEAAHYRRLLADNGIACRMVCPPEKEDPTLAALEALSDLPEGVMNVLWHAKPELVRRAACTFKALRELRPELLISYLDFANMFCGLGGLMAGVPKIALSGLMAAPTFFPHFYGTVFPPVFGDLYRFFLTQPGVTLSNVSENGAENYAAWLGRSAGSIQVFGNCVTEEFAKPFPARLVAEKRKALGLRKGDPLILGVFRLLPDKRPLDFVRVVAKLKRDYPALKAVICGVGPLRAEVLALARKMGVGECLLLPGAVDDVPVVMRAASLLLHVSEAETEGLPNVILEAQAVGLPIVCTKSGGIAECLLPRWAALMRKTGDVAGLTKTCREVLKEGVAYRKYARGERKKVLKRHSIAKLTQTTLRVAGVVTDD